MRFQICLLCIIFLLISCPIAEEIELVYAEMEFPLSFIGHLTKYRFNPLSKFQTQVEGRLIKLTCDSLIDIYEISSGQQSHRPCLGTGRTVKLFNKTILNFNLEKANWPDGTPLTFEDILFSMEYRKLNPVSWSGNKSLVITSRGKRSFDAYFGDTPTKAPKLGEFYFPIVNKAVFNRNLSPAQAEVNKSKQTNIGYGRYYITKVEENRFIKMERTKGHRYFKGIEYPNGLKKINKIRMQAFPKARINRNEQFIEGRVHLITSVSKADRGYIINTRPDIKVSKYSDDSFSGFVFNCRNPYLQESPVRRAFNYIFRKRLALRKALGGEGELLSAPLPRRNFFYNIAVTPYEDSLIKAIALLRLFRYWGLDIYESDGKIIVASTPGKGPLSELKEGDVILRVERRKVQNVVDLIKELNKYKDKIFRIKIARGKRLLVKRSKTKVSPKIGILSSVYFLNNKLAGFPELTVIANNPEGRNTLVKEICGALKEDLRKIGIKVKIDYLEAKEYYPRLRAGKFDMAFRTVKLTGTPNLFRLYYNKSRDNEKMTNSNYGAYYNKQISDIAWSTKTITNINILKTAWKKAHRILKNDPPYLMLWSRRHILVHDPRIVVLKPGSDYNIPYGYTTINGLINVFNEVHLWAFKDKK